MTYIVIHGLRIRRGKLQKGIQMNASAQVKLFCKQNRINLNASARVPMLSVSFAGGAMWIEVFDNYPAALAFLATAQNAYKDCGTPQPWTKSNTK
jgi:hypothetical protein